MLVGAVCADVLITLTLAGALLDGPCSTYTSPTGGGVSCRRKARRVAFIARLNLAFARQMVATLPEAVGSPAKPLAGNAVDAGRYSWYRNVASSSLLESSPCSGPKVSVQPLSLSFFKEDTKGAAALTPLVHNIFDQRREQPVVPAGDGDAALIATLQHSRLRHCLRGFVAGITVQRHLGNARAGLREYEQRQRSNGAAVPCIPAHRRGENRDVGTRRAEWPVRKQHVLRRAVVHCQHCIPQQSSI